MGVRALASLKESIWTVLAQWGVGVMLRRALERHIDIYIQQFEEHMKEWHEHHISDTAGLIEEMVSFLKEGEPVK